MKTLIYTIAIGMFLFSNLLVAQDQSLENQKVKQENVSRTDNTVRGQNFTDENKNGVCDRFENGEPSGKSQNFIDSDKNGICDHRENGKRGNGKGQGFQRRNGQCNGQGNGKGNCGGKSWRKR